MSCFEHKSQFLGLGDSFSSRSLDRAPLASCPAILQHLFATSNMQAYTYDGLTNARDIRLLELLPSSNGTGLTGTLRTASLNDCGTYNALSYVWGNATEREPFTCSGKQLMITTNLHAALSQLQQHGHLEPLWVDAICINQEDVPERSSQVQLMGDIYGKAECTLVWLGPQLKEDCQAFEAIRWLSNYLQGIPEFHDNIREAVNWRVIVSGFMATYATWDPERAKATHIAHLLARPWFRRIWILQEVAKARRVEVLCGHQIITFEELSDAVTAFNRTDMTSLARLHNVEAQVLATKTIQWINLSQESITAGTSELFETIVLARDFQSTDPRDKLYAVLGMVSASDSFKVIPDYARSPREVFWNFALNDIMREDSQLRIFSCCQLSSRRDFDLPSWVPDWSVACELIPLNIMFGGIFKATDRSQVIVCPSAIDEVLTVGGKMLTRIDMVTTVQLQSLQMVDDGSFNNPNFELGHRIFDNLLKLVRECHLLGFGHEDVSTEAYDNPLYDAFLDALLIKPAWGIEDAFDPFVEDLKRVFEELQPMVEVLEQWSHGNYSLGYEGEDAAEEMESLVKTIFSYMGQMQDFSLRTVYMLGRKFCRTETGHLGWVPAAAQPGDCLCILYGGAVV
jgi:hypothetical protein